MLNPIMQFNVYLQFNEDYYFKYNIIRDYEAYVSLINPSSDKLFWSLYHKQFVMIIYFNQIDVRLLKFMKNICDFNLWILENIVSYYRNAQNESTNFALVILSNETIMFTYLFYRRLSCIFYKWPQKISMLYFISTN